MCCRKRSGLRLRLHLPQEMKREPETAPKYGGPKALRATPINAASSLQVNGERDWPCLARVHAQAGFFSPASRFHSHNRPATNRRLRELRNEAAYEFKQSTTMFFHRFLVPTMVMMHFFLGLI